MIVNVQCEHCGGQFENDGQERTAICPHCGKETSVKEFRPGAVAQPAPAASAPPPSEASTLESTGGIASSNQECLVDCPDCKKPVSPRAVSCPNCGCPISQSQQSAQSRNLQDLSNNVGCIAIILMIVSIFFCLEAVILFDHDTKTLEIGKRQTSKTYVVMV